MAEGTARQLEEVSKQMKQYVDPRTGTVSFSGADMTGVIFLPVSTRQLRDLIQAKQAELDFMRADYQIYRNNHVLLTDAYLKASIGGNPGEIAATSRDLANFGHIKVRDLEDKINSGQEEIGRLQGLQSKGGKYTRPLTLFDIQTISISSHREKFPVRTLGRVHPKSYTRGPRTLAGSFIFTLFNKAALWDLLQATKNFYSSGVGFAGTDSGYPESATVLVDQLPPFDLTIICSNELGDNSYMALYGVEIVNEGLTLSIQDIITENVMQFVARDFEPMRPLTARRSRLTLGEPVITVDNYLKGRYTERQRRRIRLNPFV